MDYFNLILKGILLGATLSFVVGPAMISLIQTSINHGFKSGMYFALGILISDICLVFLAFFGFSSILESNAKANTIISIIGGTLLIIFGTYTFAKKAPLPSGNDVEFKRPFFGTYILKGFLFNIINPSVWFYWLIPVGIATTDVASYVATHSEAHIGYTFTCSIFFVSMLLTIFSFDLLKCGISYKLKKLMTERAITFINKVVGIILIIIGIYLIVSLFDKFEFIQNLPIHK